MIAGAPTVGIATYPQRKRAKLNQPAVPRATALTAIVDTLIVSQTANQIVATVVVLQAAVGIARAIMVRSKYQLKPTASYLSVPLPTLKFRPPGRALIHKASSRLTDPIIPRLTMTMMTSMHSSTTMTRAVP